MVFDDKTKKRMGLISIIPATCFFLTLMYYLGIMIPALQPHDTNFLAEGITHRYYDILFAMLAVSAVISASVLIYFLVTLARMKNMNAPSKMIWVLLLVTFVPIAFIAFWYFLIRREPRYVGIYPDIA
jgi:phosphoglycerol transferase MdoB-like AlkP superfamily enzyme